LFCQFWGTLGMLWDDLTVPCSFSFYLQEGMNIRSNHLEYCFLEDLCSGLLV
jgi:hypothetical protein